MTKLALLTTAAVLALVSTAQAQYGCEPERAINALARAVQQVAPLFMRPPAGAAPPAAAPPLGTM